MIYNIIYTTIENCTLKDCVQAMTLPAEGLPMAFFLSFLVETLLFFLQLQHDIFLSQSQVPIFLTQVPSLSTKPFVYTCQ